MYTSILTSVRSGLEVSVAASEQYTFSSRTVNPLASRIDSPMKLSKIPSANAGRTEVERTLEFTSNLKEGSPPLLDLSLIPEEIELLAELGRGAMGIVYKALDHQYNRFVALKVSKDDRNLTLGSLYERLLQADHPNCVKIYAYRIARDGGAQIEISLIPSICMEDLFQEAQRRRESFKLNEILSILSELISVVSYCNTELEVYHRDIKMENMLVRANGQVVLCDFGLGEYTPVPGRKRKKYLQAGTPIFMSPDSYDLLQGKSKKVLNFDNINKAEAWQIGLVAFLLWNGHLPFDDSRCKSISDLTEIFRRDRIDSPRDPLAEHIEKYKDVGRSKKKKFGDGFMDYSSQREKEICGDIRGMILRCLSMDHNDRPTTASLQEFWENTLQNYPAKRERMQGMIKKGKEELVARIDRYGWLSSIRT